ncbi:MAG: tRNA threonylcarbamoyladenosine biosynthesis protein TsaE [Verrucomicrobiales bacterium]|jgi:tRNA threonylcarbamoyladenosine biosynthesis protein TsaE
MNQKSSPVAGTTIVNSVESTMEVGKTLASELAIGNVIALVGGLGAGKTHLTKGIIAGLGASEEVTSPTFTLVHEYTSGRLPAYHFDFYRIDDPNELIAIGWDEYLEGDGVVIVEWADKFPELLPPSSCWLKIEIESGETRRITRQNSPSS